MTNPDQLITPSVVPLPQGRLYEEPSAFRREKEMKLRYLDECPSGVG
jgi:hypothetical protein